MKRLAIFGASGHGKVAADIAILSGWQQIDFFDDAYPHKMTVESWGVIGNTDDLIAKFSEYDGVFVAIGTNAIRLSKFQLFADHGFNMITLIHPTATISTYSSIAEGCILMPGAVVNSFAYIDSACIINSNAVVEHDCRLDSAVHVCPGSNLAGEVIVGANTLIGIGSSVVQCVSIAADVTIGAGSTVTRDIETSGTYAGSPARPI